MNKLNFHIDKDLDGVEIMSANILSQNTHAHTHQEYAIGVMERGVQSYDPKRKKDKYMVSGDIPVVNPFTVHNSQNLDEDGFSYRMFYIDSKVIEHISSQVFEIPDAARIFDRFFIRDHYVERNLIHLHHILENNAFDIIQKQNYFYEVIAYLLKTHSILKAHSPSIINAHSAIQRVEEYIHARYSQKIELKDLSKVACMSPYHLNRLFAKKKGLSPHQYLINLRLNKARELLKSNYSATEISHQVGFYDQAHFTRNFKLYIGITPKQYQKQII
ncbi:helix-turn-helix transcriptional regulator [Aureibacter tunicatorum]|uniref:AraC-like DNA-binding protein n=1 Tax=Aureibacter tunicatorum TaxID=866807 RepID=A0AAE3XR46_9BACT|nr:AraC family transcriptional regulator [Aureibacter tunicatorum]MDR6240390.1 AraC-like DNA-binding protein [Aureibacter tunicatorum]BDD05730.1 AraC family transcriptional regulator [Aureibacter tunicatorum]